MSPELIEIIDTAVKIGLGALIAGISAYLLAKSKYSHEEKSKAKERRVRLLEDVALKIEDSSSKLDKACHPFWLQVAEKDYTDNQESTKKSISHLLESRSIAGQAKAMSLLLGESMLGEILLQCEKKIENLYHLMSEHGIVSKSDEMNVMLKEINKLFRECYVYLEAAYDNT